MVDALVRLVNRSMVGTVTAFKILSERWLFRPRAEIRDMSAWCTLGLTQGQLGACVLPVFMARHVRTAPVDSPLRLLAQHASIHLEQMKYAAHKQS
jgi:hypothetical protein